MREDAILPHLDAWIASLVTPEALATEQDDLAQGSRAASLWTRIRDLDRKIASLVAAVESGAEITALTDQLAKRSAERAGLQARLRGENSAERLTVEEMEKALADLGGIAEILPKAAPALKAKLYVSLGVRLEYDHVLKRIRPPRKPRVSLDVSGGGLEPPRPLRALAPQASASAIPPPGQGDTRRLWEHP